MSDTSNHKRPAAEPLERFVDADTQPIKKRKLDLVKCDRCRDDKVKVSVSRRLARTQSKNNMVNTRSQSSGLGVFFNCLPVSRTFPEKCDRCEAKDLPCSEGKRAKRKSKHTPDVVPSSSSNLTEGADTKEFEDQFQRW
ncbi:hypothetical protein EJ02DRAFT_424559 [Clathrospora elynae]|uniref:Uncharacterized protein n=1 Tax=Clathrospora elynae TaxID=706981 RepID=A0A6A5SGH3_9PLEO|nr:hypothetical protein EJ02DRAFT_424559 [Clathrospora elynae]